jgi:DNA-directed RNA polymerase subunit RPC12/RpoP
VISGMKLVMEIYGIGGEIVVKKCMICNKIVSEDLSDDKKYCQGHRMLEHEREYQYEVTNEGTD